MSRERPVELECPQCGAAQTVTVWDTLNANITPRGREQLFQGKINTYECGSCQVKVFIPVPLMYHDMRRQFVVQYFPFEALEDDGFLARFAADGADRVTADAFEKLPSRAAANIAAAAGYMHKPHVVFDMGELIRYVIFRERVFDRDETGERP